MIIKTTAFQTTDAKTHPDLEEAQKHEIKLLIAGSHSVQPMTSESVSELIVNHASEVLDILSTKASSRPRARKINKPKKILKQQPESTGMP